MSPQTSSHGWLRYAWPLPAALAAVAVSLLCWGAWVYGYDPNWLSGAYARWRPVLGTDQDWMLVVTLALLLGSLAVYWWPRRGDRVLIGLIAVVVLAPVAAILGTAAYVPCRGHMSTTGVTFWIFQLYVGQPPNMVYQSVSTPHAPCGGTPRSHCSSGRSSVLARPASAPSPRRRCCGASRSTGCSPGSRPT